MDLGQRNVRHVCCPCLRSPLSSLKPVDSSQGESDPNPSLSNRYPTGRLKRLIRNRWRPLDLCEICSWISMLKTASHGRIVFQVSFCPIIEREAGSIPRATGTAAIRSLGSPLLGAYQGIIA